VESWLRRTVHHLYTCAGTGDGLCWRVRVTSAWVCQDLRRQSSVLVTLRQKIPHHAPGGKGSAFHSDLFTQYHGVCGESHCGPVSLFRGRENSFRRRQKQLAPISHDLAPFPTSINTPLRLCIGNQCDHHLEIRCCEEGVATGRLLPCSWNGFSFSISESRRDAFVKTAPSLSPQRRLSTPQQLLSASQGMRRIVPLTRQCKSAFTPCARGNEFGVANRSTMQNARCG